MIVKEIIGISCAKRWRLADEFYDDVDKMYEGFVSKRIIGLWTKHPRKNLYGCVGKKPQSYQWPNGMEIEITANMPLWDIIINRYLIAFKRWLG